MRNVKPLVLFLAIAAIFFSCTQQKNRCCNHKPKKYTGLPAHPKAFKNVYFNLKEGLSYSKLMNKPILFDFTGHGAMNCHDMYVMMTNSNEILKLINEELIYIALYVDDKTELHPDDFVVTYKNDTLKSLGKANLHFQIAQFKVNAQPYFVVADHDFNILSDRGYDMSKENFIKFLEEGLEKFNEESKN